jgi:hypothetical protein
MPDRTITQRSARYRRKLITDRNWRRVEVFVPAERVAELRQFARRLREPGNVLAAPNAERINDRAKLLYHRLVVRYLRHDPALIERTKGVVDAWSSAGIDRDYVGAWRALLKRPVQEICAALISRAAESQSLRLSSPFPFVDGLKIDDDRVRRRLWHVAKRASAPSRISSAPYVP